MHQLFLSFGFALLLIHPPTALYGQTNKSGIYIEKQPADLSLCAGGKAVFQVSALPADVPKWYQWQVSSNGNDWADVRSADNAEFVFSEAISPVYSQTKVRVKISAGKGWITSDVATVAVQTGFYFIHNPEKQMVVEGGNALFSATPQLRSANVQPNLQWQYSPFGTGVWYNLAGETRPILTLIKVKFAQNGHAYRLMATSPGLCDTGYSQTGLLSVIEPPVVAITPGHKTFCGGGNATFSVKMQGGTGKEAIQWQLSKNGGQYYADLKDGNNLFYLVPEITESMTGWLYRAVITYPGGVVAETPPAIITVYGAMAFEAQPRDVMACLGDSAIFNVKVNFKGKQPEYQWQSSKNGVEFQDLPLEKKGRLAFAVKDLSNDGLYFRALISAGGCQMITSAVAKLSLYNNIQFAQQPQDFFQKEPGQPVEFTADIKELGPQATFTWQWSDEKGVHWLPVYGAKDCQLTIRKPSPEDVKRIYRLKASNAQCGWSIYSKSVRIWVNPEKQ